MYLKSPNHIDLLKMIIPIFLYLIIIPFASPSTLSFDFNYFSSGDDRIRYERAYVANNTIQLTVSTSQVGRATYTEPVQLWDKASRNLADFTTHFSFIIDSQNRTPYGDGLAFFLAPAGSRTPGGAGGGTIGLTTGIQALNSTDSPFVAVEFDIYRNDWDPEHDHVGIDINSMRSVSNTTWWSSILNGRQNDAWVNYNSSTKNLSAMFTGFINDTLVQQALYYVVDLRDHLPELVTFGFSAATGDDYAKQSILSWSFHSTLQIKRKSKVGVILGSIMGGLVGILLLVCVLFATRKRRLSRASESGERGENRRGTGVGENRPDTNVPSGSARIEQNQDNADSYTNMDEEFERSTGPRKFSYEELALATNNFAEENKLGRGLSGVVYEGSLGESKPKVAVKKMSRYTEQGLKQYKSEVRAISGLRPDEKVVKLYGWCHERNREELLLVYEFMPNGSLDSHLFNEANQLSWSMRYKIAQDIALALQFLHDKWGSTQYVVHRDIKSSNILLDSAFNAKLGDFGFARIVDCEQEAETVVLVGTPGYVAPEGNVSNKSDVYSFGIVALEIACGRKALDNSVQENHRRILKWVWQLYEMGNQMEAADPKLDGNFDEQEMERLITVGLWCANPDHLHRPAISEAIRVLNSNEATLPDLPRQMPIPTSYAPPWNNHG